MTRRRFASWPVKRRWVQEAFAALEKTPPGKNQEIQLTDALRVLAEQAPMYAYVIKGKRYDTGDKLGFLKATVEFGLKHPEFGPRRRGRERRAGGCC